MNISEVLQGIVEATTQRGNMTKREARDMAAVIWDINNRLEKLEAAESFNVLVDEDVKAPVAEDMVEAPKKPQRRSSKTPSNGK